ncbi:MAG: hypothetical protein Q8N18_17915 [Opitutaceae bacterium]|nr:hypothetical protein [Opitutaceae bacterium]
MHELVAPRRHQPITGLRDGLAFAEGEQAQAIKPIPEAADGAALAFLLAVGFGAARGAWLGKHRAVAEPLGDLLRGERFRRRHRFFGGEQREGKRGKEDEKGAVQEEETSGRWNETRA